MINPLAMKAYDEYFKLAKEYNLTMVQLAQAFVNSRPFVTMQYNRCNNNGSIKRKY